MRKQVDKKVLSWQIWFRSIYDKGRLETRKTNQYCVRISNTLIELLVQEVVSSPLIELDLNIPKPNEVIWLKNFLSIVLFLALIADGNAQFYPSEMYKSDNSILPSKVYSVQKDDNGLIWLGTDYGLFRFDGISFKRYHSGTGFPDNKIFHTTIDRQGFVYCHNSINEFCALGPGYLITSAIKRQFKGLNAPVFPIVAYNIAEDYHLMSGKGMSRVNRVSHLGKDSFISETFDLPEGFHT